MNSQSTSIFLDRWTRPKASLLINIVKLWITKKKMANLRELDLRWDNILDDDVLFAFMRKVSRVLGLTDHDEDEMATGEVCRVDGVKARVTVKFHRFFLNCV